VNVTSDTGERLIEIVQNHVDVSEHFGHTARVFALRARTPDLTRVKHAQVPTARCYICVQRKKKIPLGAQHGQTFRTTLTVQQHLHTVHDTSSSGTIVAE
jgi:hypothetical protein